MMKSGLPDQTTKDLKVIHNEAKRAARVMTDLLTYSLGASSKSERSEIHRIIHKVLSMRYYAQKVRNISTNDNLPDSPVYVQGDPSQLAQVFMNIILNAEESLDEVNGGTITISTETGREWIKISISDNGTGIPEENLSQIFYPFFTTKRIGEGTGLGLSICYGIVTSHGGLIHAENNETGGATFVIELPLA
jgi:signal transduction histidine kinase